MRNTLDWDELDEQTPVLMPGPTQIEIEICNRLIHNEIGPVESTETEKIAIALIYALINLSEHTRISIAELLTGFNEPKDSSFCQKNVMFKTGRLSIASTLEECSHDYSSLITDIFSGTIHDPLYGAYRFFNYIEDINPEVHRKRWGIGEEDGVKIGIIYGKFEYDPIPFLRARAHGVAFNEHLEHWESQKALMM